jgi:uncharacterized protein (TIGR02246 family)
VALAAGPALPLLADADADASAIRALIQQTEKINNRGDADAWVALFEDGAVYMPPGMPEVTTREGLVEIANLGFSGAKTDVTIEPVEIRIMGDWAYARSHVKGTAKIRHSGETVPIDMKQIVVYHRQGDGSWKIARLIGNRNS